jgi:hypothetical protein
VVAALPFSKMFQFAKCFLVFEILNSYEDKNYSEITLVFFILFIEYYIGIGEPFKTKVPLSKLGTVHILEPTYLIKFLDSSNGHT